MSVLVGLIPDPAVIVDGTGTIIVTNSLMEGLSGYKKEQLIGKNFSYFDFISTENKLILRRNLTKRLAGSKIPPYQLKIADKKGQIKCIEIKGNHITNQGNNLDLVIFQDVTSEKEIQNDLLKSLREQQQQSQEIINSIKEAIILVDNEGKVTYWNPAAEEMFGYTKEEAIGKSVHKLVVPETMCKAAKERIVASVKTFAETGTGYFTVGNVQVTGRRKDGSEFPAELSISPIRLAGKWSGVGLVKDITRRKKDEQKIQEGEQRYHALFNQAPLGVLVVDPVTASCVDFNDTAHEQLGYTREEFATKTIYDLEAKETTEQTDAHLKEMVESGGDEFETVQRTKNGELKNVIVTVRAFQSCGKSYLHAIFHDITKIKEVETALMQSEAQYRQLVELAQEGIWAIDNDLVTVFVNPRMAQMLGYKESEMLGRSLFDFMDVDMVGTIKGILVKYSHNTRGQYDYAFPHKAGGHVDTTVNLSLITDDQNQKIGILAVVSDITQRKQIEKELKESEERFRAISTSAMDAIILSDAKDRVLYWNPAAEKTFGFSSEEAIGKKLSQLVIPPVAHEKHAQLISNLSKAPVSRRHFGLTALRKDESSFPMDLSMVSVQLKNKNCLLSIIRDITHWKAMEDALRQERDMLESVGSSNNAAITIVNHDYRIMWANQRAKQVTGRKDLENKHCYAVFGNSAEICPGCGVKKVLENGANIDRHDYHGNLGNQDYWLELIATPIKDKDGNVVAALEVAMDITERKRLQNKLAEYSQTLEDIVQKRTEQLRQTQEELVKSERLAAIGELAGMIGHDLRNPLTGIKNATYYLQKKGSLASETQVKEMLQTIDKCVNYSNKVINDLLDYSREIHVDPLECSLRQLMAEAFTILEVPSNVQVSNNLPDNPRLTVDPDKIQRVFVNLTKNAIDALPNGGTIKVEGKIVTDNIKISFTDNGVGISNEILPKLFSPLFTTKAQGMGFGLAICKRIVEAHGGTISVSTIRGKGTTFVLTLPLKYEGKLEVKKWIPNIKS